VSALGVTTGYTRAQLAAAVDEAHGHLHAGRIGEAHDALHTVGAGTERTGCATPDPEAQRLTTEWIKKLEGTGLPCGHKLEDLIGGGGAVTKCGACLAERQSAQRAAEQRP